MKIKKSVLLDALKVIGKVVCQTSPEEVWWSVQFLGVGEQVRLTATDGVESVVMEVVGDAEGVGDFAVEYKALREQIRTTRGGEVEVAGERIDWPVSEVVPEEAVVVELPEDFALLLGLVAPIVDRTEVRRVLQGINLSADGIAVTDGKQLLNLPVSWTLAENVTLPFPLALLTAKPEGAGRLYLWNGFFKIEIGNFTWLGRLIEGRYPDWRQVISAKETHDYVLTILESERVVEFLKVVPDYAPFHGIELNVTPKGVTVIPVDTPNMTLEVEAELIGVRPRAVLALNNTSWDGCYSKATGRSGLIRMDGFR